MTPCIGRVLEGPHHNSHQRYKVTETELLSIEETLKEFRTILLGQKLQIYTDYKNPMCNF